MDAWHDPAALQYVGSQIVADGLEWMPDPRFCERGSIDGETLVDTLVGCNRRGRTAGPIVEPQFPRSIVV